MDNSFGITCRYSTEKTCVHNKRVAEALILLAAIAFSAAFSFLGVWVHKVSLALVLLVCIIKGVREKTLFNPYFLFCTAPLSLLLYVRVSYGYMLELTNELYMLALINMTAFIVALDLTPDFKHYKSCKGIGNGNQHFIHIAILAALFFFPTIWRKTFGTPFPLESVLYLLSVPLIMCTFKTKNILAIAVVILFFAYSILSSTTKSSILIVALTVLIAFEKYFIKTRKGKLVLVWLVVLAAIVMITSFYFANQYRGAHSADELVEYYSPRAEWSGPNFLFMPYMYFTTPWANLQYVIDSQNTRTYGLWLLKPLISYLQFDGLFAEQYTLTAYSSFNTFTFIATCFKDFGFFGSIFSSAFLGFFVKKIYSRSRCSRSPLDLACYAYIAQAVLEMFFSNHFYSVSYPFTIVLFIGLYKFVFCSQYKADLEPEYER